MIAKTWNKLDLSGWSKTAHSYDPSRGIAFRTYAYPRIRGAIVDEMRKNTPVSQQMLELISTVKHAVERLESPVTPEMIANETGLPLDKVEHVLEAMRFLKPQKWNDLFCNIHSSWKSDPSQPGAAIEEREIKKVVADCIEKLPDRERLVLTLLFRRGSDAGRDWPGR